jgi:tetratricopeptide (TPR) repeat protein
MRELRAVPCFVLLVATSAAVAQVSESDWRECKGSFPVVDHCTTVIESGKADPASLATAYFRRGMAQFLRQNLDAAIHDYSEAIRLAPTEGQYRNHRGTALIERDDLESAREDFDEAVRLSPRDPLGYINRGYVNFILGDFESSAQDYERGTTLPNTLDVRMAFLRALYKMDAEEALWLQVARLRAGRENPDELERAAKKHGSNSWPGPLFAYFRGKAKAQSVLRAAEEGSKGRARDQRCQAAFFLAEAALAHGDAVEAKRLLVEARDQCPAELPQARVVTAELRRLPGTE